MSSEVEEAFVAHLLDVDSMSYLAAAGFDPVVLPTIEVAGLWSYALTYYLGSEGTRALSPMALASYEVSNGRSWADVLADLDIDPDVTPELSIADTVLKLRSQYAVVTVQRFNRSLAEDISAASTEERLGIVEGAVAELVRISMSLRQRRDQVDTIEGVAEAIERYHRPTETGDGLRLGMSEIDDHFMLVQPGEVMFFGGAPKSGKSVMTIRAVDAEWTAGRRCVLFTLENSINMTIERLICAHCGIDSMRWQTRQCDPEEIARAEAYRDELEERDLKQFVLHPASDGRDVASMMARATAMEAQSVIIDQVSHILPSNAKGKPRWEQVRDIVQSIKEHANGPSPVPVLVMAQMSRDGIENASRHGYYEMAGFAESSEIERSADFAVTMYQSNDMRTANMAVVQTLAARRVATKDWSIDWYPALALARVRSEITLDRI
jgi:replicative DNA helicase